MDVFPQFRSEGFDHVIIQERIVARRFRNSLRSKTLSVVSKGRQAPVQMMSLRIRGIRRLDSNRVRSAHFELHVEGQKVRGNGIPHTDSPASSLLRVAADTNVLSNDVEVLLGAGPREIRLTPYEKRTGAPDRRIAHIDTPLQDAGLRHMVGPKAGTLYQVALWLDIPDAYADEVLSFEYDFGLVFGGAPRIKYPQISPENKFLYVPLAGKPFTPRAKVVFRDGNELHIEGPTISLKQSSPRTGWEHYVLAFMYNMAQRHDDALRMVDRALEMDSTITAALALRGMVLADLERFSEARQALKGALDRDPLNPVTLNEYAWFLVELLPNPTPTDLNDALLYAQRSVQLRGSPQHFDTLGWVHYRLENFMSAIDKLREAERFRDSVGESSGTWLAIQNHLGHVLLALNRPADASRAFQAVVDIGRRYELQNYPYVVDAAHQLQRDAAGRMNPQQFTDTPRRVSTGAR